MSGYRPEYTRAEQQQMVKYILEKDELYSLRGTKFWKDMEASGEFKRTWQSMKNHFQKTVVNNLHFYDITHEEKMKLKDAYQSTELSAKVIPKEKIGVYSVEL